MILHLVEEEKFLSKAIQLFEDTFPGQNVFLVGTKEPKSNPILPKGRTTQIIYQKTGTKAYKDAFVTYTGSAELLFFHNLYKTYKLELDTLIPHGKKLVFFLWGAELYGLCNKIDNLLPLTKKNYFGQLPFSVYLRKQVFAKYKRDYYWSKFKKLIKNKVNYTLTNITEDISLLNTYAPNKAKKGWFTYFSVGEDWHLLHTSDVKNNILIGNSSSETNNHFDAFQLLENKNISDRKLYIPLNYGDPRYRELVIADAEKSFGGQAEPLLDFMSLDAYYKIVQSCSVLLMNHTRQQAFNTIMLAIAAGCKVFLREENTILKCLIREGFWVYSIQNDFQSNTAVSYTHLTLPTTPYV